MANTPAVQAIKGFADMFAPESRVFQRLEDAARAVFPLYGYGELRTPLMEYTDLFCRSIGAETDVVQKEMYTLADSKGRSMSLRPEATAGVMRAYIEHGVHGRETVSKLFTVGPMFRHERPQKGRLRQFHQINCECLGVREPEADAELVCMLMAFLGRLGLTGENVELQLNTLGCPACRPAYRELLTNWLNSLDENALCEDCRRRKLTNPLRVLDCKAPTCKEHTEAAPRLIDHVCPDCSAHFAAVTRLLEAQGVPYALNHRLVRGLDYYTRTTFEVVAGGIGAQSSVAGGGRYDGLVASLGGPDVPGLGFACGMERLALLLGESEAPRPDFYLAALDDACRDAAFALAQTLRGAGLSGGLGFESRSVKSVMRQADKSRARHALLIGPDELAARAVVVKNMQTGEQLSLPVAECAGYLTFSLGSAS